MDPLFKKTIAQICRATSINARCCGQPQSFLTKDRGEFENM
jgi:hypothetical protein